jgi:hypothetical protein
MGRLKPNLRDFVRGRNKSRVDSSYAAKRDVRDCPAPDWAAGASTVG